MPIYAFVVASKTVRGQNRPGNLAVPSIVPPDRQHLEPEAGLSMQQLSGASCAWQRRHVMSGVMALMVPGGSGLVWLIVGRPNVQLLLGAAAVIAIAALTLNAAAAMYQARQETLRKEIERRGTDALAGALARFIDDTHARAQGLPATREAEEAARVRASAAQMMADMSPTILALLGQPPGQPCVKPSPGQEAST